MCRQTRSAEVGGEGSTGESMILAGGMLSDGMPRDP